jgi:cyclic beta-1,2-glucan synthetase
LTDPRPFSCSAFRPLPAALAVSIVLLGLPASAPADSPVSLADAPERGAFNVGAAQATAGTAVDPVAGGVLTLDFRTPRGTAAGVWAKGLPSTLNAETADVIRLGARAAAAEPANGATATVEIKGTAGVQRIPLPVRSEWAYREVYIDWSAVGELKEVVVAVSPVAGIESATGTVHLDVRFEQLPTTRRLSTHPAGRLGGVVLLAGLAAMMVALLRRGGTSPRVEAPRPGGPRRDFVRGIGVVAIAGLVLAVYHVGGLGRLEVGWVSLGLAVAGTAVAAWLKWGLTGRHLTASEVLLNGLATGFPAASASPLVLLQAPATWSEILLLSQTGAAGIVLAYHVANFCRLTAAGRHLDPALGALVVGSPYAIGGLLLLRADNLLHDLALGLVDGPTAAAVGRVFVVFAFNAAVANGLSLATRRTLLRSAAAHFALLAVAAFAVAAPWVAAAGSSQQVADLASPLQMLAAIVTAAVSQAGLWAEVYLVTGLALDALRGKPPAAESVAKYPVEGAKKAAVFAAAFMAIVHVPGLLRQVDAVRSLAESSPILMFALAGALAFPLVKTVIETFDGSQRFFGRVGASYRNPVLYARGAVVGLGVGYVVATDMPTAAMGPRVWFGLAVGAVAYAGVNLIRDAVLARTDRGVLEPIRAYVVQALLGGFIGAAVGFYFDAEQVTVVSHKFHRYLAAGVTPEPFGVLPFLSKWGFISLGTTTGGVSLLFAEALAGVIEWSIPAWLFAVNRTVLEAYFRRDTWPIRGLFTRDGLVGLTETMIAVFRWGLWMSPIIKSFLRPMGEPTWYNQDGAVRTVLASFQSATSGPAEFRAWSLDVFVALLAHDLVRVAIWVDHMGLRVATLVNLSFLGMDRLDARLARSLTPAATARFIPEAVKRFTTWAPLLIPFYIPRGADWDYAWGQSQAIQKTQGPELPQRLLDLPASEQTLLLAVAVIASTVCFTGARLIRGRFGPPRADRTLANPVYELTVTPEGAVVGHASARGYDVSRRSYDLLDPAGRALFLVEPHENGGPSRAWPVVGNCPDRGDRSPTCPTWPNRATGEGGQSSRAGEVGQVGDLSPRIEQGDRDITITNAAGDLAVSVEITLPDPCATAELWTVTVENPTDVPRAIGVVPYLEWVLNKPGTDRGHTQYNRLFAEVEYVRGLHAVLAWDKHAKAAGFLAADAAPDGFLSIRADFVGRGRTVWAPRALETLAFAKAEDTAPHATFDPIGSLLVWRTIPPHGSARVRFLIGLAKTKAEAIDLIACGLQAPGAEAVSTGRDRAGVHPVGHGEVPAGTPQPYFEYADDGRRLIVRTPFTPRPWDHTMSNALGHVVSVTNRGLNTSCSVNAQQNRLTPDWPDTVTRELPGEAIYLYEAPSHLTPRPPSLGGKGEPEIPALGSAPSGWYDQSPPFPPREGGPGGLGGSGPGSGRWFSPTYHPLNDPDAEHVAEFRLDGTATFYARRDGIETELTVFVPPDEPAGVYLLTVRNRSHRPRRLRVAPYFQMVLGEQPESAGPLQVRHDPARNALFFVNPRNRFRQGPAFVAMSGAAERVETRRGRFFGAGRDVGRPAFVERGEPDTADTIDNRPVAAFLTTIEIPPGGESTVVIVLGQADDRHRAEAVIEQYRTPDAARTALEETRRWWLGRIDTVRVRTTDPTFDGYVAWLHYQALAERLWARRGFYQASGAYGFRDQLQDAVNLLWADPALARRQIVLHAAQQFAEGDVAHWFHLLEDGRTGMVGRTYASDTLVWLPWAVVEYLNATGDDSVLDERAPYLEAEQSLPPLPAGKGGMGFEPLRSARAESVYRHCGRAIDLVLDRRMGANGLPLMLCGDWNDGLDEIGSEGHGESIWLGFFLLYVLDWWAEVVDRRDGLDRAEHYRDRARRLREALERTWRGDRYLRAIHDDGTEIGVAGSGVWEIDALTAAWAVIARTGPERGRTGFDTAVRLLEQETTILLGRPPLREDTKPYLGRSSWYPEGVRENGMYCHGVQWLVGAARLLADRFERTGNAADARRYRDTAYRLWRKIAAVSHTTPEEVETYGGQPNKQAADLVTTFDPGRMIWNGYTGAAGWMFRQALEGVLGYHLDRGAVIGPVGSPPAGLGPAEVRRMTW